MNAKASTTFWVTDPIPTNEFIFFVINILIPEKIPSNLAHVSDDFITSPRIHKHVSRYRINNWVNENNFTNLRKESSKPS